MSAASLYVHSWMLDFHCSRSRELSLVKGRFLVPTQPASKVMMPWRTCWNLKAAGVQPEQVLNLDFSSYFNSSLVVR